MDLSVLSCLLSYSGRPYQTLAHPHSLNVLRFCSILVRSRTVFVCVWTAYHFDLIWRRNILTCSGTLPRWTWLVQPYADVNRCPTFPSLVGINLFSCVRVVLHFFLSLQICLWFVQIYYWCLSVANHFIRDLHKFVVMCIRGPPFVICGELFCCVRYKSAFCPYWWRTRIVAWTGTALLWSAFLSYLYRWKRILHLYIA